MLSPSPPALKTNEWFRVTVSIGVSVTHLRSERDRASTSTLGVSVTHLEV